jgi:tripartite-type tricarboxylate transporter receptor subunit TctC
VAPPGTPADIVATLRQAFMAMAKDPVFLQDAARIKADIVVNTGEQVAALFAKTYATPRALIERAIEEVKRAGGRP